MSARRKQQGFAIYKTPGGIELHRHPQTQRNGHLICLCHNYLAALRIARQAATLDYLPFTNFAHLQAS